MYVLVCTCRLKFANWSLQNLSLKCFFSFFVIFFFIDRSEASGHHMAKLSLICNDSLTENETFLEYINTTNVPIDSYVSMIH